MTSSSHESRTPLKRGAFNKSDLDSTIAKGALVNVFGILGKMAHPLLLITIARLYGAKITGAYGLVVISMMMVLRNLSVSGINDGIQMFGSRAIEKMDRGDTDDSELYRVFANGFAVSVGISLLCILFVHLFPAPLLALFPEGDAKTLQRASFALPFYSITVVIVACTKTLLMMKWDAILESIFIPLSTLVLVVIAYLIQPTLTSLIYSYVAGAAASAIFALFVFGRYFSFRKLGREFLRFRLSFPLLGFAIPQNLNMTFNTFITQMDVLMLGYFNFPLELIGFYTIGAQIVLNIRQIKLAFSGIYAPIISRLQARADLSGLNESFSMVTRWIMTVALPAALLVALFRDELVVIWRPEYSNYDNTFMLLLLVPPLVACTVGLAANVLVMTGHSTWNLCNSIIVAGLNVGLNYFFIPRYGMLGAALASAIAATSVALLQVLETYFLEGVHGILSRVYKPVLAILPGILMATYVLLSYPDSFVLRLSAGIGAILFYIALLWGLGFPPEDQRTFLFWKKSSTATQS